MDDSLAGGLSSSPPNSPLVSPSDTLIHNDESSPFTLLETSDFTSQTDFDSFFSDQAVQTLDDMLHDSSSPQNSYEKRATADFTAQANFDFLGFSDQAIQTIDNEMFDDFDGATVMCDICTTDTAKGKRKIKGLQGPKTKRACRNSNIVLETRQSSHSIVPATCLRTACRDGSRRATRTPPRALSISVQTDCRNAVTLATQTKNTSACSVSTGIQTIRPLTSPMSVQTDCHYQTTGMRTHNVSTSSVSTGIQTTQPSTAPMSVQTDYSYGTRFRSATATSALHIPFPLPPFQTIPRWDATST